MGAIDHSSTDDIRRRGSIKDADVMRLRAAYYSDGNIGSEEAETLFALNDACPVQDRAWSDFFIEAVTDYIVNQAAPEGYITAANAEWLMRRIARDGQVSRKSELELLINVLDKARWSPASLVSFTLEQVKSAVLFGEGPLRDGSGVPKGTISESEVELVRRVLYAFGGDGNVAVTRAEAEILFDINDALGASGAHPAWIDLFVKAIANVVMAASGYSVPTREEALRREVVIAPAPGRALRDIIRKLADTSLSSVRAAYREQSSVERALARLERQRIEIITNEEVTEGEAGWLAERLGRDGKLTPAEDALVSYLFRHATKVHPALADAVERLARAA